MTLEISFPVVDGVNLIGAAIMLVIFWKSVNVVRILYKA